MIHRLLKPSTKRSFFLFGARGTGKSTILHHWFSDISTLWIDLLSPELEDRYSRNPELLKQQITGFDGKLECVIIDEVQKVPKLLNVVHQVIEQGGPRFALTGSSARKLKRGSTNLLAGRAFVYNIFPFTSIELGDYFSLNSALAYGTLPGHFAIDNDEDRKAFLRAYALTYIKEEIWSEQLIRKLDPFRAFLEICAQCNGEIINFSNIARQVGVDTKTVQSYYQILEDTLLGFMIEPYHKSVRKRQLQSPRFYLFDTGVKRALDRTLNINLQPNTYAFGRAFEHFVVVEAIRRSHYLQNDYRFYYLKTKDGAEIDLVIDRPGSTTILLEIKSSTIVDGQDIRILSKFADDIPNSESVCLSLDPIPQKIGNVNLYPWDEGLKKIGLDIKNN